MKIVDPFVFFPFSVSQRLPSVEVKPLLLFSPSRFSSPPKKEPLSQRFSIIESFVGADERSPFASPVARGFFFSSGRRDAGGPSSLSSFFPSQPSAPLFSLACRERLPRAKPPFSFCSRDFCFTGCFLFSFPCFFFLFLHGLERSRKFAVFSPCDAPGVLTFPVFYCSLSLVPNCLKFIWTFIPCPFRLPPMTPGSFLERGASFFRLPTENVVLFV